MRSGHYQIFRLSIVAADTGGRESASEIPSLHTVLGRVLDVAEGKEKNQMTKRRYGWPPDKWRSMIAIALRKLKAKREEKKNERSAAPQSLPSGWVRRV